MLPRPVVHYRVHPPSAEGRPAVLGDMSSYPIQCWRDFDAPTNARDRTDLQQRNLNDRDRTCLPLLRSTG
jgi:hypothetical protein